ncbi:MAG: thioredoxin family protein [Candidatus Hydrogenedentota bacterium]
MKKLQVLGPGCASCEKLAEMTQDAAQKLGIEFELTKVKDIDAITSFGVLSTPALVVDGEVKVSGRVPSEAELKEMIS